MMSKIVYPEIPEYITPNQANRFYGIPAEEVRELIKGRRITYRPSGKWMRVKARELEEYIERTSIKPR
ncbi:MAG: helix-turn-helix domain-containing protein [Coriobacteriia bacterium]|nr:helix-turn-helix domain-containing protein [Coriobacteriia bacterium]